MHAVICGAPGEVRTGVVPDPTSAPDELVIRVGACGICGTDLHIFAGDNPLARYPVVPGHEFAGEVVALGTRAGQTGISIGCKVAVDPNFSCGYCEQCRAGRQNLCLHYSAIGVSVNGALAEYVVVPEKKAYVLPDSMSYPDAALIEPVSCAVHGMHGINPKSGDTFLIAGAGTMGLMLLQLAVRGGASRGSVIDLQARPLALAEQLGARRTYGNIQSALADEPLGFNCVIDTTGVATVIEQAFGAVKRGGKFMIFGVAAHESRVSLSTFRIYNEEPTIGCSI